MKATSSKIIEATRLTREGRLSEATALIQKALSGENDPPPKLHKTQAFVTPPILDLVAEEVTVGASDQEPSDTLPPRAAPPPSAPKKFRVFTHLRTAETRPNARQHAPSDLAPASGKFLSEVFSNTAGARNYKLYIPSGVDREPRPLIIMLHGCTQWADDFAAGTRMNFAAEDKTCFVAFPEQSPTANSSRCWNWFHSGHQMRGHGEPSIIAGIAMDIMSAHSIDPRRVYIAGLSAGGAAAAVAAQAYPDVFAALGVHSGLACGTARDLPSAFLAMQGQHPPNAPRQSNPIPTIVFHGDQDRTVHPRNAADVAKGAAAGNTFEQEVERGVVPAGRRYSRSIYRDLSGKRMIEDWLIHGAGHAWSGGSAAGSFTDPRGPDATKEMLRFFLEHEQSK